MGQGKLRKGREEKGVNGGEKKLAEQLEERMFLNIEEDME